MPMTLITEFSNEYHAEAQEEGRQHDDAD